MTLTRMALQNFGCHEALSLDFTKKKVLILGDHATGKSTILDAITWLFTGRCRGLDAGGRGVKEHLLKKGADGPLSVTANVVIKGTTYQVTRTFVSGSTGFAVKTFGPAQQEWSGGTEDQEAAWFSLLGVSREATLAMLDAETFLHREHADAKGLLLDFLNASITVPDTGEIITLQECDRRYTGAFERRKDVNRTLKRTTAPQKPDKEVGDIEAVKATLKQLEDARDVLVKRQGALEGLGQAAGEERARLQAEYDSTKTAMPDLPLPLSSYLSTAEAEVKKAQKALDANNAKLTGGTLPELAKIKAHEPEKGCVLNPAISCKTSLTEFVQFVKKHSAPEDPAKPSETAKLLEDLDRAKVTLDGRKNDVALFKRLEAKLQDLNDRISALDDKLAERGDGAVSDIDAEQAQITAELAETTARLEKGRTILSMKQGRELAWRDYARDQAAYQALVKQSDEAEAEVALYGPKGIRVQALEEAITGWQAGVNAILEPFGYSLSLSVDPWGLIVNGQPTARLSTSERLRVVIALQVAMAGECGFNFTLIDSVDWLLKSYRLILTQVLTHSGLDQVVMAKAQDKDVPVSISESTQVIQL